MRYTNLHFNYLLTKPWVDQSEGSVLRMTSQRDDVTSRKPRTAGAEKWLALAVALCSGERATVNGRSERWARATITQPPTSRRHSSFSAVINATRRDQSRMTHRSLARFQQARTRASTSIGRVEFLALRVIQTGRKRQRHRLLPGRQNQLPPTIQDSTRLN